MTLTTILPSLRRSIPDPIVADRWPECTSLTTTDVIVAGVPMIRLSELCGTPCVHSAAAVIPGTDGRPAPFEQTSVIVTRVLATNAQEDGYHLTMDACLSKLEPSWSELRLIGRSSTTHSVSFRIDSESRPGGTAVDRRVLLPRDLAPGDLLAVPCRGTAVLRQLRPERAEPADGSHEWWRDLP